MQGANNTANYVEGSDNTCPSGYQRITDRKECDAADLVLGRISGTSSQRGDPFETADDSKPCGCFRRGSSYYINHCSNNNNGKSLKDAVMYCKSETAGKGCVWCEYAQKQMFLTQ